MSEPAQLRCARCQSPVDQGQEYCLECGGRLEHRRAVAAGPGATAAPAGLARANAWILPALFALLISAGGAAGAIALSREQSREASVSTATGGSLTATESTQTLTAPEPTGATRTAPPPTAPTPTAPARPTNPATITWPRERRGWTIVLLSLPQANGRDAAAAKASEAREGGLRRVGILDSSRYASLHPGYYVVFTGVFEDQPEAASALQRARAVFPAAYAREIVP